MQGEAKTSQEPNTLEGWRQAYFNMMDSRDDAVAARDALRAQRDALVEALEPILVWIHAHPRKATLVTSVIDAADAALAAEKKRD